MSVKLSNKSKPNNGVNEAGTLPSRCPIGVKDGPVFIELLLLGADNKKKVTSKREQSRNAVLLQK